jgi:integrase/recombinase XerD
VPDQIPRTILSERETLRLLEAPPVDSELGVRDRAILEVLYGTGLRNTELCQLNLDELDFARHLLRVSHGKGDKPRLVPLGEEAEIWLQEYLLKVRPRLLRNANDHQVFLGSRGCPLTRARLATLVSRWARRAGLQKHTTPHTLRHSCATHMLAHGADLRYIQAMLGHSSPETTQRYTRVEISDLRKVILRCHPRERPQLDS